MALLDATITQVREFTDHFNPNKLRVSLNTIVIVSLVCIVLMLKSPKSIKCLNPLGKCRSGSRKRHCNQQGINKDPLQQQPPGEQSTPSRLSTPDPKSGEKFKDIFLNIIFCFIKMAILTFCTLKRVQVLTRTHRQQCELTPVIQKWWVVKPSKLDVFMRTLTPGLYTPSTLTRRPSLTQW